MKTNPETTCAHCSRDMSVNPYQKCSHGGRCVSITEFNELLAPAAKEAGPDGKPGYVSCGVCQVNLSRPNMPFCLSNQCLRKEHAEKLAKEDGIPEETEVECVLSSDNPKVDDCSVCKTSIWHKQGYMQDDDGKSYHIMCRVMQSSYEQIAALKAENAALLAKLAPVASLQEPEGDDDPEVARGAVVGALRLRVKELEAELRKLRSQESK